MSAENNSLNSKLEGIVIRPPSEADSFLLQVTKGCSHNKCSFCITYKFTKFTKRSFEEIAKDIDLASRWNPSVKGVFLCDGNAMTLSFEELVRILDYLQVKFPLLERVGIYANARDVLEKSPKELEILSDKKLKIAYLGLESGNDEVLARVRKGATSEEMIQAVIKAQEAGMKMSVIVLLGLGGKAMSSSHAIDSGRAVSRMNPAYLSALTLMLLPGTPLYNDYRKGNFELMDPESVLHELGLFLENTDVENTIFRTNHASNYLPIGGTLPQDKEWMLEIINHALENPSLLRPEHHRAL